MCLVNWWLHTHGMTFFWPCRSSKPGRKQVLMNFWLGLASAFAVDEGECAADETKQHALQQRPRFVFHASLPSVIDRVILGFASLRGLVALYGTCKLAKSTVHDHMRLLPHVNASHGDSAEELLLLRHCTRLRSLAVGHRMRFERENAKPLPGLHDLVVHIVCNNAKTLQRVRLDELHMTAPLLDALAACSLTSFDDDSSAPATAFRSTDWPAYCLAVRRLLVRTLRLCN
jgi:hypothetical protein